MATCGSPFSPSGRYIKKRELQEYLDKIEKRIRQNYEQEINVFYHCTSKTPKRRIMGDGVIRGSYTDVPARAPLASNEDIVGIWFSIANKEGRTKSPYGTQKMILQADNILAYLKKDINVEENEENCYPENGNEENKEDKATNEVIDDPRLFFECAHHYGGPQYVRLLLARATDPTITWCEDTCIEIDFKNNGLLEYRDGKFWSCCTGWGTAIIEVMIVGDIYLDQLSQLPDWRTVKKQQRAGTDPAIGLC